MIARIPILDVTPVVEHGRYPVKAVVNEAFDVEATTFCEGLDSVAAGVVLTDPQGHDRPLVPMRHKSANIPDRYLAEVSADAEGSWTFRIESWIDPYATWRQVSGVKIPAGVDVELTLLEGAELLDRAAKQLPDTARGARDLLASAAGAARDASHSAVARVSSLLAPDVAAVFEQWPVRDHLSTEGGFPIYVDRERALVGSWYEFFPRSAGATYDERVGAWISGTFATAAKRLPAIADMGFDVVYLPPVHPIGEVNRKGRNNSLVAEPGDPGSPWAIGSAAGGHDSVDPALGTLEDFRAFVARANSLGIEVALDLALQCAPDHPWVSTHPQWFNRRIDGGIAYAENPPKKYQDIYPLNFDTDFESLFQEIVRIVRHWVACGVRIFRVDNPHTKPLYFWERFLAEIRATDPDVVFLAEAFTRPAVMRALGMVGFHQSYTYFTWRNDKAELETYLSELSHESSDVLRPNLFVNTPDILTEYLQSGGRSAFAVRAALAATAGPSWGVYSGFELYENVAVRPGSEEYLDSEKYQFRPRNWESAERTGRSLAPYLRKLNAIRRRHLALRRLRNLAVHQTEDAAVLAFSKHTVTDAGIDTVIVVANLDPHSARETLVHLDLPVLGYAPGDTFPVTDELTGSVWRWGARNYVRLDPADSSVHILSVQRP